MIDIPVDQVPELPVQDIINNQCVAYGVFPEGVVVHYLERDIVRLIEWEDIVIAGIDGKNLEFSKSSDGDGVREIDRPVMP